MKTFHYIIVKTDKAYDNETELSDGTKLVTGLSVNNVNTINRIAEVIAAPEPTILEPGDQVILHHNIFRRKIDVRGEQRESDYYLGPKEYFVPLDLIFAYKRGDSDWEGIAPFFFVKPIEKEIEKTESGIYLESGVEKFVHREAEVKYSNKHLREEWGVNPGDVVGYGKNQEYEFEIEGELLYRVRMPMLLYKK